VGTDCDGFRWIASNEHSDDPRMTSLIR
jgi:hypothetical protein